jgi:cysteine-S-conjugate beta-lyase
LQVQEGTHIKFDFDTPIDRRGTSSDKWDKYAGRDVIPMWIADMDFRAPPCVLDALRARIEHGVFGYTSAPPELAAVISRHLRETYQWDVYPQWFMWLPGLVTGLNVACRAIGDAGDEVLTATPVYPPFLSAPRFQSRTLRTADLVLRDDRWQFDFDALERAITPRTKMMLLCSPHNPVGRVFAREELRALADICARHDLTICSDEIHCGLLLDADKPHVPIAALDADTAKRSITLMAPSKTFNIPGLYCSFAIIPDTALRQRFLKAMQRIVPHVNALGYTAALAAYRDGAPWHAALIDYLRANRDRVEQVIGALPNVSMAHVEATYLAWIDVRALQLEHPAKHFEAAGVGLSDGADFGAPGFVRLNFGCPRASLDAGLERFAAGLRGR